MAQRSHCWCERKLGVRVGKRKNVESTTSRGLQPPKAKVHGGTGHGQLETTFLIVASGNKTRQRGTQSRNIKDSSPIGSALENHMPQQSRRERQRLPINNDFS